MTKNTRKANTAGCPVKAKGLDLKPYDDGRWIDQYGRVLEVYTRRNDGKQDLRPVGVGVR